MNVPVHDYSRHSDEELQDAIYDQNVQSRPERVAGLQRELGRRLAAAQRLAAQVSSDVATNNGARFDELDPRARARFFWPMYGIVCLLGIPFGFLVNLSYAIANELLTEFYTGPQNLLPWARFFATSLASAIAGIPYWLFLLRLLTKRSFGDLGLKLLKKASQDAA